KSMSVPSVTLTQVGRCAVTRSVTCPAVGGTAGAADEAGSGALGEPAGLCPAAGNASGWSGVNGRPGHARTARVRAAAITTAAHPHCPPRLGAVLLRTGA